MSIQPNASGFDIGGQSFDTVDRVPICFPKRYGVISSKDSCFNAWSSIPTDATDIYYFGARTAGHFEAPLPRRYLSSDGLCAIDINPARGSQLDSATYADISENAAALLSVCVWDRQRGAPVGGVLGGVGRNGHLTITVRSYMPDIECYTYPPFADDGKCSKVVDTLYVSHQKQLFTRESTEIGRHITIPYGGRKFTDRSNTCTAIIDLAENDSQTGTWFDIWAGAIAVLKVCVAHGQQGTSYINGDRKGLMITLVPSTQ